MLSMPYAQDIKSVFDVLKGGLIVVNRKFSNSTKNFEMKFWICERERPYFYKYGFQRLVCPEAEKLLFRPVR